MTGLLGKIFGGKRKDTDNPLDIVEETLQGVIEEGQFDLAYEVEFNKETNHLDIDIFGEDEELVKAKDGQLLDALQLYVKRVLQHQLPEKRIYLEVDCAGFREQANQELLELADKLKGIALSKNKSVYFRALPPKDRKVIHQYLAEDGRVKSRSVGDGHYKKIKIYPVKSGGDGGGESRTTA